MENTNQLKSERTKYDSNALMARKLKDEEKIHRSITIKKSPAEIYTFFRNFGNLPYFMKDLVSLTVNS